MSAYQARRRVDDVEWVVRAERPPGGGFRNRRLFVIDRRGERRADGLDVARFAFLIRDGCVSIRRDALPDDVLKMLQVAEQVFFGSGGDD